MMKINNRHIRVFTFLLTLLLLGGITSEAWAVRYHILTKPFNVRNHEDTHDKWTNIRVEALLCESNEFTIGLPDQFKSPLATNFKYWGSVNPSALSYDYLYDYANNNNLISAKYYIYQCSAGDKYACLSDPLTEGASVDSYTDIYVTYDYVNDDADVNPEKGSGWRNGILELDGGTEYNIGFINGVEKFMCLNRSRNNRVSNANGSVLTGEQLADKDFVVPENGKQELGWPWGSGDNKIWGPKGIQLGFILLGFDPYNITIMTSYEGKEVHVTDNISGDPVKAATIRPYKGATLFGKMGNDQMWFDASNDRHYLIKSGMTNSDVDLSTGNYKNPGKYETRKNQYNDADVTAQFENWVGYYRKESYQEVNTYAVLPHPKDAGRYMFVVSKLNMGSSTSKSPTINQPDGNKYYLYNDNGATNKPSFTKKTLSSAYFTNFYEIREYTIHVKTHGSSTDLKATMRWSDARLDDDPADHVPEVLKRKYCNYTAYSDPEHNYPITSFREILEATPSNYHADMHIYLDYTVSESMPFETLPAGGSYQNARWYTMRMDGVTNPKYVAYNDGSSNVVVTNGSGVAKGSNTTSQIHQGENSAAAMVAFMGDPYELKILNRKACETATAGNKFIGCSSSSPLNTTLTTNNTGPSDITTWEIVYESTGVDGILLRQFNTAANPKYIGLGDATNDKPVTYSATSSRIRVVELDKKKYAFHIMRDNESIAVMATTEEEVGKRLKGDYTDIPEIIRSPYLSTATVNFYATQADAEADNDPSKKISNLPYNPDELKEGVYANIYVRYSFASAPSPATYNVRVNSDYIYIDGEAISSKTSITDDERGYGAYQWTFNFSDPYALTIHNAGNGKYMKVSSWGDNIAIGWSDNVADASLFIAKSGSLPNTREVMAATGDGVDASTTYYNIGRPSANTVKLYSNSIYLSGNATLRFQLSATGASEVIYHLVDMYNNVLLDATTRQALTEKPAFPPEYYSPLVKKYYYHETLAHAQANRTSGNIADDAQINQTNIWVTYDVNDLVDLKAGQLYLMKYEAGDLFRQENGGDDRQPEVADMSVNPDRYKAVYPYVNGDGNFFVYGQEQYDLQQEGASSTRTRWAWYVESNVPGAPKGDPYHVTIKSRQTESYPITNSSEYNAYFMTYKPDGYSQVVTTLGWPGMNSETATEYMVLGSEGQYQLVTTNEIGGSRYVVDSFEQYWKTFDVIKKKIYGSSKEDDGDPIIIPDDAMKDAKTLRNYLKDDLGWHSYEKWAYAKRWNGYNNGYSSETGKHETKKGWEKVEHWYQTVKMGEGYFDFVKTSIDPVLILLDQHGWEIMRKPLPAGPDDTKKEVKYAAIRPYNSPMVKEYAFWATAKKRSGFHQYYQLKDRVGGENFTSTDLTNLPPYGSANVLDKKGNQNDQYVTYIVKDEYAKTYNPADKSAKPFLIEQGTYRKYATTNAEGTTLTARDIPSPYTGNMKAYILNGTIEDTEKWYVKPNVDIDNEMGYSDLSISHDWKENKSGYELDSYKNERTAHYIDDSTLGQFSFSNGFDPYNIQISSVKNDTKYMKTNANGAELHEGSIVGSYPDNSGTIAMGDNTTTIDPNPKWYDSRNLYVTNATFMAVQDAAGNMQLMPRFDHSTRMSEFGTLIAPTDADVATTYTKLYRPEVYEYLIIDNDGHESLRYKTGGDMTPQTPDHFKSPLATNFTYYATATIEGDTYTIDKTKEIKGSLDGATLNDSKVYVRYEYDEESDNDHILKGNWLTMQLDENNTIYNNGIKKGADDKPSPVDTSQKDWQWKFLETPQSTPDPYALYIYNRSQAAGTEAIADRFALLSHSEGDYALAKAGLGTYTYQFLNGSGMNESTDATIAVEPGFTPTAGTFDGTKSQVILTNDVQHTFIYKVYTNGGVNAIDASQTQEDVYSNDWKPVLPGAARTPLLNMDQYRYYEHTLAAGSMIEEDTLNKVLPYLYGLYEDIVFTHYTAYNPDVSNYLVPNVRNDKDVDPVAPGLGSNDAPVGLDGKRPYNIYWYQDNIMKSDGATITSETNKVLQYTAAYEWEFEGDDPYAIKIKSVGSSGKYIHDNGSNTCNLNETPTTFMLLNRDGYDYGVFTKTGSAVTGGTPVMLSGYGNTLTTGETTGEPTKFIPFALSTYKVIYHLMIKNIDSKGVYIPYRDEGETSDKIRIKRIKSGTTLRDLEMKVEGDGHTAGDYYQLGSSLKALQSEASGLFKRDSIYCVDAGHVSLGDAFEVPQEFYRPNVSYDFYIEGVYDEHGTVPIDAMNAEYKGLKMTNLGEDTRLLGNIVFVNIVYNFMGGLDTNSGSDFVESVAQNKWYTFETNDATPMLAEYSDELKTKSGYATHYTNDYLWTPVGDPYGFKMYNRYIHKNLGGTAQVMSTTERTSGTDIEMVVDDTTKPHLPTNSVYELLSTSTTTPGYFRIRPVANMKDGTQVYMRNSTGKMTLNTVPTEWTFGLSEDVMRPYYLAAGYVGGLNEDGKAKYEEVAAEEDPLQRLMYLQDVVYNHDKADNDADNYIVHYEDGYYRLHSQPGSSSITTPPRYMSGYTHAIERDVDGNGNESDAIPLHFYEVEEYSMKNPTFRDLESGQYTVTNATQGDIPLVTVTNDPASIFKFTKDNVNGTTLSTQGLYVKENKMTATVGEATKFDIVDIGAGIVALQQHGGTNYLKYAQNEKKYDLKFDGYTTTIESARWCMKPVQKEATAKDGEMPLTVKTNNGGDGYYYTTFCAPFDVLMTSGNDEAYVIPTGEWPATVNPGYLNPRKIGQYNLAPYEGNNQFIPAGTPVIIRTKNTGGIVTMVLPNSTPSDRISCLFTGKYLEQMLTGSDDVYVLGRSYTHSGEFEYASGSGVVTPAGLEVDRGVGFYINANPNKEASENKASWTRNNKYVYANKIYYRAGATPGASAPAVTRGVEFIPVIFDDDENGGELQPDGSQQQMVGDGCIYDLMGRKVATEQQVQDGSWNTILSPGIYIINGKKFSKK